MKRIDDNEEEKYLELKGQISFNIRKYRKEKHLTQEELAESANISYDFMRRIETSKGKCGFSVYTIYKIALALNVSMDELFETNSKDLINSK